MLAIIGHYVDVIFCVVVGICAIVVSVKKDNLGNFAMAVRIAGILMIGFGIANLIKKF